MGGSFHGYVSHNQMVKNMEVSPFYLTISLDFPCEIMGKPPGYIPTIRVGQAFGRMLRMVPGCGAEATEATT